MDNGFFTVHRKIFDHPLWKKPLLAHLAIHLIGKANHETKRFLFNGHEQEISRGQLLTGRFALAKETGLSPSSVRNNLKILENIGFLDIKSTNKFSVITLTKYSQYQDKKDKKDSTLDNQRTTRGQPEDTNNNDNNYNNENNREGKSPPAQIAKKFFSDKELQKQVIQKITEKYNADINAVTREIGKFVDYWTESNKSGTRQKWETQNTFEVDRRIKRWLENIKDFQKAERKIL